MSFPLTGGGGILTIVGPCFDVSVTTAVKCIFESHKVTLGVVSNKLRAYCPIPTLTDDHGEIQLTVIVNDNVYHTHLFTSEFKLMLLL